MITRVQGKFNLRVQLSEWSIWRLESHTLPCNLFAVHVTQSDKHTLQANKPALITKMLVLSLK